MIRISRAFVYVVLGALLVGTATYLLPGNTGAFVILAIVSVLAVAELWNRDVFRLIEARTDAAAANPSSRVTAEILLGAQRNMSLLLSSGLALKALAAVCASAALAIHSPPAFLIPIGGVLAGAALPLVPVMLIANHALRELEVTRKIAEAQTAARELLEEETRAAIPKAEALKQDPKLKKFSKVIG